MAAAVSALDGAGEAPLYVLGDATALGTKDLNPFREVRHLNLNIRNLFRYSFLAEFTSLRPLIIQGAGSRPVVLEFSRPLVISTDRRFPPPFDVPMRSRHAPD